MTMIISKNRMNNLAVLQFFIAKGVGDSTLHRLASLCRNGNCSPEDILAMSTSDMADKLRLQSHVTEEVRNSAEAASILADDLLQNGIKVIWISDKEYPTRVRAVLGKDAPPVLFAKGNLDLLSTSQLAVGFCGSRKASEKGIGITAACSRQLACKDICVVSGYASGVDMAAHHSALESGGATIFVLVEGILRFKIKQEISGLLTKDNHLVISQFPPRMSWISHNAMRRNATIVGLSDAMILVESGLEGGTFAAGQEALKRHHPLFVVDFAKPDASAEANPYFIKQGGIRIRGQKNKNLEPNLAKVLEIAQKQSWKDFNPDANTLFNT